MAPAAVTLLAMATWSGAREFFQGPGGRWEFPNIDDQTPVGLASPSASPAASPAPSTPPTPEQEPARIPSRYRMVVAGVIGIIIVACAIAAIGVLRQQSSVPLPQSAPEPVQEQTPSVPSTLLVHVTGAVNAPGVLELEEGSRVFEAVDAAGGVTAEADADRVNLARPLMDGEHIVIPRVGEVPAEGTSASTGEPISLSRSPAEVLVDLPGVGPALAQRIVAWREENGGFQHIDDVLAVSGIGPATLEGFRDQVVP